MITQKSRALAALLLALPLAAVAQTPAAPAVSAIPPADAAKAIELTPVPAATVADAMWAAVEAAGKLPDQAPQSLEEAQKIFGAVSDALAVKGAAFEKEFPADARRWQLAIRRIEFESIRRNIQMPAQMTDEAIESTINQILAAEDASQDTKGSAAFYRVAAAVQAGDMERFTKLGNEFVAAYPAHEAAPMIKQHIAQMAEKAAADKALKEKPVEIKFTAVDGREIDLAAMKGKVVLIDFWATWCGPCVKEIPNVVAAYEKLHPKGFEIIGISFDQDKDALLKMTQEKNMPWAQYFDGKGWENELGQKYGITSIPAMWLIGKDGKLVDTNARANLAEKVEKLLAE